MGILALASDLATDLNQVLAWVGNERLGKYKQNTVSFERVRGGRSLGIS